MRGATTHYPRDKAVKKRWNFLVITIDALRPDRLSLSGYERETSPNIDALALKSHVFDRAYAPANSTRHSIAALFAGRAFSEIDLDRMGRSRASGCWNPSYFRKTPSGRILYERPRVRVFSRTFFGWGLTVD